MVPWRRGGGAALQRSEIVVNYAFLEPWHEFLPREGGHVIALCGGGGKTALMALLAEHYKQAGVPLILTTTTRTEPLPYWPARTWDEVTAEGAAGALCLPPVVYLHAGDGPDHKWIGVRPETVDALEEMFPDRVVVVEADGAGKCPLKIHHHGEPLWPRRTSLAVAVLGTGALGRPARDALHRLGRVPGGPLNELDGDTPLDWDHLETLLMRPGGYLDRVPAGVPVLLALTQLGDLADGLGLFGFLGRVMAHPRLPLVLLGELDPDRRRVRVAYRCGRDGRREGGGEESGPEGRAGGAAGGPETPA
jgi:probable selenium-dependent hydroxylase accessory protein YqeC